MPTPDSNDHQHECNRCFDSEKNGTRKSLFQAVSRPQDPMDSACYRYIKVHKRHRHGQRANHERKQPGSVRKAQSIPFHQAPVQSSNPQAEVWCLIPPGSGAESSTALRVLPSQMSMDRVQMAKMIADAGIPVHLVEARVAGVHEAIGLVEEAKSTTEVDPIAKAKLDAGVLIQRKVLVRSVLGKSLLCVARHACLDRIVGLDMGVVEPHQTNADRQDSDPAHSFSRMR